MATQKPIHITPAVTGAPAPLTTNRALEAAEMLVAAYRNGQHRGGHVDWEDVDQAWHVARAAVAEDRCHRRRSARPVKPSAETIEAIREHATYLLAIADPGYGDYDINEALNCATELARLVVEVDLDGLRSARR